MTNDPLALDFPFVDGLQVTFISPAHFKEDTNVPNKLGIFVVIYSLLVHLVMTLGRHMESNKPSDPKREQGDEYSSLPADP